MTKKSTCNNLIVAANQIISGNILSSGNLQTNNLTSTSINNSGSLNLITINGTSGSLTNLSVFNILTLLSNTPIRFVYNGTQYNLSALMLYSLYNLSGSNVATQSYVNQQISNLVNGSPDLLNTLHWEIDYRNLSEVSPIISDNFIGSDKFIG